MRFDGIAALRASAFEPQVVIVGTGPAGLTVAMRLEEHGVPSLLIEAGGYERSEASQAFYRGRVVGDPYFDLHTARLRCFGGTSGHWAGWCRPLDAADFEPRPELGLPGWPIGRDDLQPYAAAAEQLLKIGGRDPDEPWTADIDAIRFSFSPPVRFGTEYRERIESSTSIGLLLDTTVVELVPDGARIAALQVVDGDGRPAWLTAKTVCLCTGGIENSRLLLWSNERSGGRVVPQAALLGRRWMEHPSFSIGAALLVDGAPERLDFHGGRFFAPSVAAKRAGRIGAAHVLLEPQPRESSTTRALLHSLMCLAPAVGERLYHLRGRELHCGAMVFMEWEQMPLDDNRIELDAAHTDPHGVPQPTLHWRKTDVERRTAREVARLFGEALIERQLGRLRMASWLVDDEPYPPHDQGASWHHMGGTAMAASPEHGIVDRDCRVFGLSNLYIGGSSVFPTSGHANPTYTIVQLALRLADHLASRPDR